MNRPVLLVPSLVGALLAGALTGLPAASAGVAAAPTDCPTALPTVEAVDGLLGTGYTVERGETIDPFSATVLGRIDDGIGPDVDMIIAQLSSDALTRSGGVWAGMSGSPVYAEDGRLIGAVAYVLASNTSIAGITPAEDMLPLVGGGAPAAALAALADPEETVVPSAAEARELAASGALTYSQARAGFGLLDTPVSASGARSSYAKKKLDGLSGRLDLRSPARSTGASSANGAAVDISAGSNFAAALSYGTVTLAGVGTTTAVCDGQAVAFGHPLLGNGDTTLSAHSATAVLVQPDPLFGSFKVANPGPVVGTVTRDTTTGIAGPLGEAPTTIPVTTSITSPTGVVKQGSTQVVLDDVLADVAAIQTQSVIDSAYGSSSAGSASYTVRVNMERADGTPASLVRTDRVASRSAVTGAPVSFLVADSVYFLMNRLVDQDLEDVDITSVEVTATTSTAYDAYTLRTVERRQVKPFAPLQPFTRLNAGQTLQLRLGLTQPGSSTIRSTTLNVPVPADAAGGIGALDIVGGSDGFAFEGEEEPESFDELLADLRTAPGSAYVSAVLSYETTDGGFDQVVVSKLLKSSVRPVFRSYELGFR